MAVNITKIHVFNLLVKILPPSRFNTLKVRLLRWAGVSVGKGVSIFTPKILGNFDLVIGDYCWIGHDALIFGASGSKITMEPYSKVASRAIVVTGVHDYGLQYDCIAGPGRQANVTICKGALVGTNAMICLGKIVGEKAHVAAFSVVTHDVPPFVRVAGVPARVIKKFEGDE